MVDVVRVIKEYSTLDCTIKVGEYLSNDRKVAPRLNRMIQLGIAEIVPSEEIFQTEENATAPIKTSTTKKKK